MRLSADEGVAKCRLVRIPLLPGGGEFSYRRILHTLFICSVILNEVKNLQLHAMGFPDAFTFP